MNSTNSWESDKPRHKELVSQALNKAQRMGFIEDIDVGSLIARYSKTVAIAELYSRAKNFAEALEMLGGKTRPDMDSMIGSRRSRTTQSILSTPSNLTALGLIACAHIQGWDLVVEDCPFSEHFIRPLAQCVGHRIGFLPYNKISRAIRAEATAARIYVTFPDRPFDVIAGTISVDILNRYYRLSIVEALLSRAPVDHVYRYGSSLIELSDRKGSAVTISEEELLRLTQEQARFLEEAILADPIQYLGWLSLYSRSEISLGVESARRRSFFQCVLRYSQQHGMPIARSAYEELVARLEHASYKSTAQDDNDSSVYLD